MEKHEKRRLTVAELYERILAKAVEARETIETKWIDIEGQQHLEKLILERGQALTAMKDLHNPETEIVQGAYTKLKKSGYIEPIKLSVPFRRKFLVLTVVHYEQVKSGPASFLEDTLQYKRPGSEEWVDAPRPAPEAPRTLMVIKPAHAP